MLGSGPNEGLFIGRRWRKRFSERELYLPMYSDDDMPAFSIGIFGVAIVLGFSFGGESGK